MAKYGIRIKLDVKQIDKARLFTGKKGVYLDATVFVDVDNKDQYDNNGMITQDVSKEEREQGVKGNILGNVQVFFRDESNQAQQSHDQGMQQANQAAQQPQNAPPQGQPMGVSQQQPAGMDSFDDNIPF